MKYFLKNPFIQENVVNELEAKKSSIYYCKNNVEINNINVMITEKYFNNDLILVIYNEPKLNYNKLFQFHCFTYGENMYYQIENWKSKKAIEYLQFKGEEKTGSVILHFNDKWDVQKEHSYDSDYNLIEYREFSFDDHGVFIKQNIFFASSWIIDEQADD